MFTTNIEWHNPADELPKLTVPAAERVLIYTGISVYAVFYSPKYKLFNALDSGTEADAQENAITPLYWAYMPEFPKTESEGA